MKNLTIDHQLTRSKRITYSALLIGIGLILPRIVALIPIVNINSMLSPMHIPLLLAGFILGWRSSIALGITIPLLSFILTGMPPLFPVGLSMMFELSTYGIVAYFLYQITQKNIYVSLIGAMICGRIMMGIVNTILLGAVGIPYGFKGFLLAAFVTAIPGIILHLITIPPLVKALESAKII